MKCLLLFLLIFVSCGNKALDISSNNNVSEQAEAKDQGSQMDTLLVTTLADGKVHEYYQVFSGNNYNLHTRIKGEKEDEIIKFAYDRYNNGTLFYTEGFSSPIIYTIAEDKRYIFVIADIHANSNGWISEYQIFKVDLETNKTECIAECAAIEAVPDGFIVAQARLTNEDTATCTADEVWLLHDEKIDFDGKVVKTSKQEYDYKTMEERFLSEANGLLLKGFKSCTSHKDFQN